MGLGEGVEVEVCWASGSWVGVRRVERGGRDASYAI